MSAINSISVDTHKLTFLARKFNFASLTGLAIPKIVKRKSSRLGTNLRLQMELRPKSQPQRPLPRLRPQLPGDSIFRVTTEIRLQFIIPMDIQMSIVLLIPGMDIRLCTIRTTNITWVTMVNHIQRENSNFQFFFVSLRLVIVYFITFRSAFSYTVSNLYISMYLRINFSAKIQLFICLQATK